MVSASRGGGRYRCISECPSGVGSRGASEDQTRSATATATSAVPTAPMRPSSTRPPAPVKPADVSPAMVAMLETKPSPHVAAMPCQSRPWWPSSLEFASPSAYGLRASKLTYGARIDLVQGVHRTDELMLVERSRNGTAAAEKVVALTSTPVVESVDAAVEVEVAFEPVEVELATAWRRRRRAETVLATLQKSIAGCAASPTYSSMLYAAVAASETTVLFVEMTASVALFVPDWSGLMVEFWPAASALALATATEVELAADAVGTLPETMSERQYAPSTSVVQMAVRKGPRV